MAFFRIINDIVLINDFKNNLHVTVYKKEFI